VLHPIPLAFDDLLPHVRRIVLRWFAQRMSCLHAHMRHTLHLPSDLSMGDNRRPLEGKNEDGDRISNDSQFGSTKVQ
jgi:hypothetical protein